MHETTRKSRNKTIYHCQEVSQRIGFMLTEIKQERNKLTSPV